MSNRGEYQKQKVYAKILHCRRVVFARPVIHWLSSAYVYYSIVKGLKMVVHIFFAENFPLSL